jgi:hypothetical protein
MSSRMTDTSAAPLPFNASSAALVSAGKGTGVAI